MFVVWLRFEISPYSFSSLLHFFSSFLRGFNSDKSPTSRGIFLFNQFFKFIFIFYSSNENVLEEPMVTCKLFGIRKLSLNHF